jgi:isoleucyl-tRNA synthetase
LSLLLAPSMPFLADELYQNLVLSVDENAPDSIHLTNWPGQKPELVDDELNTEMQLVMKLASIGHAARNKAAIKVRQPLARVAFSTGSASESRIIKKYESLLSNELNVKEIAVLGSAGEAVTYTLNPLPRQLGSKYQDKFPKIRAAILDLEPNSAAVKLLSEEPVLINVEGEEYEILPDEVEIRADAKSGLTVAQDGAYLAALSTELTDELISEGYAREFIRRVQDLRKEAGFNISDRIEVYFEAGDTLTRAVISNAEYIKGEVLGVMLDGTKIPSGVSTPEEELKIDGEELKLGLKKVLL